MVGMVATRAKSQRVKLIAHVRVDSPVSTVGSSTHLGSLVYLNVLNDQGINIQTLEFCIALSILQHVQEEFCTLLRPTSLCPVPLFGLGTPANTSVVAAERNALLL